MGSTIRNLMWNLWFKISRLIFRHHNFPNLRLSFGEERVIFLRQNCDAGQFQPLHGGLKPTQAWPETNTSCVTNTNRNRCSLPSLSNSANANWSKGNNSERVAEISTRKERTCRSVVKHSGVLVHMGLWFWL
jgi:hypothetical protein